MLEKVTLGSFRCVQLLMIKKIMSSLVVGSCFLVLVIYWKEINIYERIWDNVSNGLRFIETFQAHARFAVGLHQNLTANSVNVSIFTNESHNVILHTSITLHGSHQIRNNTSELSSVSNIFNSRTTLGDIKVTEGEKVESRSDLGKKIADVSGRNETDVCPDNPHSLIGHLAANITQVTKTELMKQFPDIKDGHMSPSNCASRQKFALIFPYRNRFNHLHILLHNLIPFLIRQQADVRLFVIEQADKSTFNKGVLLNAGFSEAEKAGSFDCYIFHDVDLIPLNDHNMYRCSDNPRHFTVAINKFNYKLYYGGHFGGAVAFTRDQFLKFNGYSNLYFGWGSEDDDMYSRVHNKGFSVLRYNETIARYDMIRHNRDVGNKKNPLRHTLIKSSSKRQDVDGMNTVKYKVVDIQTEQLYTWIKITFNKTQLIQAAPSYIQDEMAQSQKSLKL